MTFKLCASLRDLYPSLEQFTNDYLKNLTSYRLESIQFLAALAQISSDDVVAHPFCFQIIKQPDAAALPTDVAWALASNRTGSFTFCEPWLTKTNLPEHGGLCGAYVTVNETDGRGRKSSNITDVRALFVELDHGGLSSVHIGEFVSQFAPSIVVESSPGKIHCYWLLRPLTCSLPKFAPCQQLLQHRFLTLRAGKEAKDLPRVLRVPGFLHLKSLASPFVVKLVHCDSSLVYMPDEIFSLLEIDEEFVKNVQQTEGSSSHITKATAPVSGEYLGAPSGNRNTAFFNYCYEQLFQRSHLSFDDALALALVHNSKNVPPLSEEEANNVVFSAYKRYSKHSPKISTCPEDIYVPPLATDVLTEWRPEDEYDYDSVLMSCPVSDESLAERIIQKYGSKINHADVGGFYVYNDLIWANAHGEGRRIVRSWMGETFAHVSDERQVMAWFSTPKLYNAFKRDLHSTFRIKSVLQALAERREIATTPDQFNREEESDVIACANGILDLPSGQIVPSGPAYRLTHLLGTSFDPAAQCPTWNYFVSSCMGGDPVLIEYIQKITGYFLSGRTHLQCIFVAYGKSGTGKSVYLNVLHKLLAGYCRELHKTVLIAGSGSENAKMSSLAQAIHCRLGTVQEVKSTEIWDETIVKALSGNDSIVAKLSHKDTISFTPRFKVCVRANDLPTSDQLDEALWARLKFLPFEVRFRGTEQQDPFITEKLINELPGVLNWAVKGFQMLLRSGLTEPMQAAAQKSDSQREAEPIRLFIEECCERVEHKEGLKYGEFHAAYESFCRERSFDIHGKKRVRKLLLGEYGYSEINARPVKDEDLGVRNDYSVRRININLKLEYQNIYSIKSNIINIRKDL